MKKTTAALILMLGATALSGCKYDKFELGNKIIKIPKDSIEKYDETFHEKVKFYDYYGGYEELDCFAYENLYAEKIYPAIANKFIRNGTLHSYSKDVHKDIQNLIVEHISPEEFAMYNCTAAHAINYKNQGIAGFITTLFPQNTNFAVIHMLLDNDIKPLLNYDWVKENENRLRADKEWLAKTNNQIGNFYAYFDSLRTEAPNDSITETDAAFYFTCKMPINTALNNATHHYFAASSAAYLFENGISDFARAKKYDAGLWNEGYVIDVWKISPAIVKKYKGKEFMPAEYLILSVKFQISPETAINITENLDLSDGGFEKIIKNNIVDYADKITTLNKKYDGNLNSADIINFSKKGIPISEIEHELSRAYVRNAIQK
jgi:hypothetical protein